MADTPIILSEFGLLGKEIIIRYGVIARHKNKDADHNFTVEQWKNICSGINSPYAIEQYKTWYNIYLPIKISSKNILVAIEPKITSGGTVINNVRTVFAKNIPKTAQIIYKKAPPGTFKEVAPPYTQAEFCE